MATSLYLIRHGESLANREKRFLGHGDWDLTENGYKQAECAAKYFEGVKVDAIYSSDLIRAAHTAEAIARVKGMEVTTTPRLREIYGGEWEFKTFEELAATDTDGLWKRWLDCISADVICRGGESITELLVRVYSAFEEIARAHDGQEIVCATHATVIRVMMQFLKHKTLSRMCDTPWVANASVTKLVYEDGKFTIEFENETSHLGSLVTVLPANV
ncbi:MAG: histidine phosphatase family protein [Oscillospiraceae bacterium]|nr:histidine phosphatase family protein [Oscillospiraceae bacterium]